MKHIGIIAEYNPFHNGHAFQISEIRKNYPDRNIVVCLSGDYVQRGEPCFFPKSLRTQCALTGGADLIIELPILFSSASSEHFATAGVTTLYKTGIVDTICFGAECDDIDKLTFLADLFLNEPANYKNELKNNLSQGLSFPKARYNAVKACFPETDYADILESPNNILAIDYIKAIRKYNLPMTPFIVKRTSDNHNSLDTNNNICSSSALRNSIDNPVDNYNEWSNNLPLAVLDIINNSTYAKPMFINDFYPFLQNRLISDSNNLNDYFEMTEELSNTINNLTVLPATFDELMDKITSKNNTMARIRRSLLNVLLSRTKNLVNEFSPDKTSYIRILGVKNNSTHLIRTMKDNTDVPIINKITNAKNVLSDRDLYLFNREINENMIYRQVYYNKYGMILPTEYQQSVIII